MRKTGTIVLREWIYTAELFFLCLMLAGCGRQEVSFFSEEEDPAVAEAAEEPAVADAAEDPAVTETAEEPAAGEISVLPTPSPVPEKIYVDVCGAVLNPGVYTLNADSRVFQAIEAAGGLLPEAAGECVNRAQSLSDGQQIYVPSRAEAEEQQLTAAAEQLPEASGEDNLQVNLNTADEAELTTLNGIGESRARDIIAYREANGGFETIEDIMKVQGIKEGTFNRIKEHIVVK